MSNKSRGRDIENFVIEKFGMEKSNTHDYDALKDGIPIEIKSAELIYYEKNGMRLGRFSILPDAHKNLPYNSRYVFTVVLEGKPLFCMFLHKAEVSLLLERYKKPTVRKKLRISEVLEKSKEIIESLKFV